MKTKKQVDAYIKSQANKAERAARKLDIAKYDLRQIEWKIKLKYDELAALKSAIAEMNKVYQRIQELTKEDPVGL